MLVSNAFRCPFEIKGERDGTIIEVSLGADRDARIAAMADAFNKFEASPESPAIRFRLDRQLWQDCTTIRGLKPLLVPFQSEILAAELELRLSPFLPHQIGICTSLEQARANTEDPMRLWIASGLVHTIVNRGHKMPQGIGDLATWLEAEFVKASASGQKNPSLKVFAAYDNLDQSKPTYHVLTIALGHLSFEMDRAFNLPDPKFNRNTFSIVKCPFYPKEFGRYSEGVEIVVTRKADVVALSDAAVQAIRKSSNEVYRRHGVKIQDLGADQQQTGLWIPQFRLR